MKEEDTPYFSNKASLSVASVGGFASRNVVNSHSEGQQQQHMEQTACFRRESTKQTCMSQCDDKNDDEIQIVTESLDTDTTSMLVGEGLSCSQSRSGSRPTIAQYGGLDTFFNQSQHN